MRNQLLNASHGLLIFFFITAVIGCSGLRPVVVYRNSVYIGLFSYKKEEVNNYVEYSSLEGAGIAAGVFRLGIGYYSLKQTKVIRFADYQVKTPIVDIYSGSEAVKWASDLNLNFDWRNKNEPE